MFVGETDRTGVLDLVLELLANAYDHHLGGRCSRAAIEIAADGTITVEDDGPGFVAEGSNGVPPLLQLLTTRSTTPTVDGHRPHFHLGAGGIGLFVVNALSEQFTLRSVRGGIRTTARCARGEVVEPVATAPATERDGTTITFRPDPTIFTHPRVPRVALARYLEDLSFLAPQFTVSSAIHGDSLAAGGLAARVALGVPCELKDVATHTGTYATSKGPIDVEVAFAWRMTRGNENRAADVDSFVNVVRTLQHGSHVDAMLDSIRAFFDGPRERGLVAAVSIVLSDVKWGRPDKHLLATAEVLEPVAAATRTALERWEKTHAALVDALRARAG